MKFENNYVMLHCTEFFFIPVMLIRLSSLQLTNSSVASPFLNFLPHLSLLYYYCLFLFLLLLFMLLLLLLLLLFFLITVKKIHILLLKFSITKCRYMKVVPTPSTILLLLLFTNKFLYYFRQLGIPNEPSTQYMG